MFEWDKTCDRLKVPADRVLRLYRSLGDTQVALPGLPSQKSSVYLCAYQGTQGVRVAVVFHLLKSRQLAIYRHNQGECPPRRLRAMLDEGTVFAESLGFLLDDMEFHLLDPSAKRKRWESLPLPHGGAVGDDESPVSGNISAAAFGSELPNPEELHERRRSFIEKLGRFLATR